jgi:PhnB protein
MSIEKLNPYLMFEGTAAAAIQHYEKTLGAKTVNISRYGDAPGVEVPPEAKDRVMHAELQVGGGVIMVSDGSPGDKAPPGRNVHVALHFDDGADMAARFDALAEGGKVAVPLQDTFFGTFGMLTDPFGVSWMFNSPKKS